VVTYTLLAITILVFILQQASVFLTGGVDLVANLGLKVNELILDGQLWRLITPMFLHGSLLHIGFNMYALLIFGPGLERFYGHGRFLLLYFLAGFAGNVVSFMFSEAPSLGSSTAIFGLLGAEGVFLYRNQQIFGGTARRALSNIIMIAIINLAIGLSPGIDNWGHLGGLIGGTIFAWLAGPVLRVEGTYPALSVVDERESRDVLVATAVDGAIFAALALATIYVRG
jgi:rhomboid protease GluP